MLHAHLPQLKRVNKSNKGLLSKDQISVVGWQEQDAYITYNGSKEGDKILHTCM